MNAFTSDSLCVLATIRFTKSARRPRLTNEASPAHAPALTAPPLTLLSHQTAASLPAG